MEKFLKSKKNPNLKKQLRIGASSPTMTTTSGGLKSPIKCLLGPFEQQQVKALGNSQQGRQAHGPGVVFNVAEIEPIGKLQDFRFSGDFTS